MDGDANRLSEQAAGTAGPTRRQLLEAAGAMVGAALLGGCATQQGSTGQGASRGLAPPKAVGRSTGRGFLAHTPRPTCIAAAPGNIAVTSDDSFEVVRWNTVPPLPQRINRLTRHAGKASYVTVAGGMVFSAGYDGNVLVTSLTPPLTTRTFAGHTGTEVWVVAASSDGKKAVSASNTGDILYWDATKPDDPHSAFAPAYNVSPEPVGALAFVPSATNVRFLSGHGDGQMILWDVTQPDPPTQVRTFKHGNKFPVNSIAVKSDGSMAASASFDMTVILWDLNTGNRVFDPTPFRHDDRVWRVAFSPDGTKIASAGEDGKVKVWDVAKGVLFKPPFDAGPGGTMGVDWIDDKTIVYTGDGTTTPVQKQVIT